MSEFPPATGRTDPPFLADERTMLDAWLDFHRATLLWKCEGLSDADLTRRSVDPSPLSLLGLVRHMTEVERNWFRRCLAGEEAPPLYYSDADPDGDFDSVAAADAAADLATFRGEIEACRQIAAQFDDLDALAAQAPWTRPEPTLDLPPHDRGVRPAQRSCRSDPGAHRRRHRGLARSDPTWSTGRLFPGRRQQRRCPPLDA